MLAVFSQTLAPTPDSDNNGHPGSVDFLKDESLVVKHFQSLDSAPVIFKIGSSALMAYSPDSTNGSGSWSFDSRGDIFCLFKGSIENVLDEPKDRMGPVNYIARVIEACKAVPPPPPGFTKLLPLRQFTGNFAVIFYDANEKHVIVHPGRDEYELYRGFDSAGNIVVSDDPVVVEKACSKTC
uniref:DUF3700 domain-containing protein n=1 Tax=Kalanchoe fedtschenkoi TaxID=63787 RepID=A0A7N0ZUB8_KALFE